MAAVTIPPSVFPNDDNHKDAWARYVARRTLDDDLKVAQKRFLEASKKNQLSILDPTLAPSEDETIKSIAKKIEPLTGRGFLPDPSGPIKIGIVGAGVAGLFTAMLLEWLNEQTGLDIDYDLLEAADERRLGGRLFTWKFSSGEDADPLDYYDVGAMRFPENNVMKRTFDLFELIGLRKEQGGLIPYYLEDPDGVCPSYFNDVHRVGDVWSQGVDDPYKLNSGLPEDAQIPLDLLEAKETNNPNKLVEAALKKFTEHTRDVIAKHAKNQDSEDTPFWKFLMAADKMSVRQFLESGDNGKDFPAGKSYNFNTIEWLETATFGTGWYDQSLSECVLEELDFASGPDGKLWCVYGGAQEIAKRMRDMIRKPVQYNTRVTAIDARVKERIDPAAYVPMTLKLQRSNPGHSVNEESSEDYFAVFNSTTLGALQRMNLKDAGLLWGTKQAIRALGYGASCKVGMKFKTAWWQSDKFNIVKGGVSRTDLPLRVCVYPSYNIPDPEAGFGPHRSSDQPSVLLCSYTWGQDAQRMGSLISSQTPAGEDQLKATLLHDLALLHANDKISYDDLLALLRDQYVDHHAYDWYHDENMSGAFAYFGPGQFSNMWQEIIKPNAFGQLYLVGEAASSHHAWVVGALESVVRAVCVMFEGLRRHRPDNVQYVQVLNLLKYGHKDGEAAAAAADPKPKSSPFWPLPSEMPHRQWGAEHGDGTLPYAAAMAALSLVESFLELIDPKDLKQSV